MSIICSYYFSITSRQLTFMNRTSASSDFEFDFCPFAIYWYHHCCLTALNLRLSVFEDWEVEILNCLALGAEFELAVAFGMILKTFY